ncbi:MAG: ATP-dependent metallopeptidase FtsH/Yme1/Tma family protein, partial [Lachnospiraceae bacterium]
MTKNNRNFNLYFLIVLGILLLMIWFTSLKSIEDTYTRGAFEKDLEKGAVAEVVIQPNKETPTGVVDVDLTNGAHETLYTTDVNEIQDLLHEYGIDPIIRDVPKENWFLTYGFPILSVLAVGVLLFFIMNAQNAGGGAN